MGKLIHIGYNTNGKVLVVAEDVEALIACTQDVGNCGERYAVNWTEVRLKSKCWILVCWPIDHVTAIIRQALEG